MYVDLVSKTTGVGKYKNLSSEEIIAAIARHGTIKKDNGKLVKYLMSNRHWSPLDMISFAFEIETSRDIGRQILRHKSAFFQEHSTRYSDRVGFEPIELRKEHPTNRQSSTEVFDPYIESLDDKASESIEKHLAHVEKLYHALLDAGVAKECARSVLPGCLTTTMTINATLRTWLSFLNVRCEQHSQREIREIAELIGARLEKELPNVFQQIDWRNGFFM